MLFRGIKSRVFLHFWILFLLSLIVFDMLVLVIVVERSISRYTEQRRNLLVVACQSYLSGHPIDVDAPLSDEKSRLLDGDRFFFTMHPSSTSSNTGGRDGKSDLLEKLVYRTLHSGKADTQSVGNTVGLFFFQHDTVIITYPMKMKGRIIAAGGLECSLGGLFKDFRRIQKIALIFAVINSFFFALFGNSQLTRIYFRPLKRLAKRAETYHDEEDSFFSVRKEDNEFFVLSSSLNKMLHRIGEDKKVLKETIGSLETANADLKKAQNDVIRAEKLSTVGRLTSGIAHEIGNPIGIVLGYLDLLKQEDLTAQERGDFIDRSEKEITRINHIIRQLLDMSRSSAGEKKPVGVHQLIEDLISVFSYQPAASHINFQSSLTAENDCVFADPDQLRQVFLNILLNGVDAVNSNPKDDARIKLSTRQLASIGGASGDHENRCIEVTIEDNGPGIDTLHLSHVFDPFYTTKQPGKGTGLGLSVSFMIVEKLGGQLSVAQGQASGAVFKVVLPLSTEENINGRSVDRQRIE